MWRTLIQLMAIFWCHPMYAVGLSKLSLEFGRCTWQLYKALFEGKKRKTPHVLIGKAWNHAKCFYNDIADDLDLFLSEISELAHPRATWFVQEQTGVLGVCNDDINKLHLEQWYSKCHLFDHFCWENGLKLIKSAKEIFWGASRWCLHQRLQLCRLVLIQ